MLKILIIEDEENILELLKFNLEKNNYKVICAKDGKNGFELTKKERPSLILLDLMLPKMDGIELCKKIRSDIELKDIFIIMITAKVNETDKVLGLEAGADDYITKPFSLKELQARIKAVLRRKDYILDKSELKVGEIVIDEEKFVVKKNEKILDLTLKEFKLLQILVKNRGKVFSRNLLLDEIWGYDYFGDTRTVDVHIRNIRKKIEDDDKNPKYIETIRGVGYKIK